MLCQEVSEEEEQEDDGSNAEAAGGTHLIDQQAGVDGSNTDGADDEMPVRTSLSAWIRVTPRQWQAFGLWPQEGIGQGPGWNRRLLKTAEARNKGAARPGCTNKTVLTGRTSNDLMT